MNRMILVAVVLAACGRGAPREQGPVVERGAAAIDATAAAPPGGPIEWEDVAPAADGRDGVHGMVIFGGETVYVSHVPMAHPPHDVQLVARVKVSGAVPERFDALYTLAPERFRLDDVLSGKRTSFRADLYRGNFEDGGTKIATVSVAIEEFVVAHPVGRGGDDEYYVIGAPGAWWAVHRVGQEVAFDSIAKVAFATAPVAGRYRARHRLGVGDVLEGVGRPITATEVDELSCLVGPDFTATCPPP